MNTKEIQELIETENKTKEFESFVKESYDKGETEIIGDFTLKCVQSEREDEYYNFVFKIFKTEKGESTDESFPDDYFKIRGDYDSWDGIEWNDFDWFDKVEKKSKVVEYYQNCKE